MSSILSGTLCVQLQLPAYSPHFLVLSSHLSSVEQFIFLLFLHNLVIFLYVQKHNSLNSSYSINKPGSPAHINNGEITKKNSRSESSCCFIAILGNTGSLALHILS